MSDGPRLFSARSQRFLRQDVNAPPPAGYPRESIPISPCSRWYLCRPPPPPLTTFHPPHIPLGIPLRYLRDAAAFNYDPSTRQRNDVRFDPSDGRPISTPPPNTDLILCEPIGGAGGRGEGQGEPASSKPAGPWRAIWSDGAEATYPAGWAEEQARLWGDGTPLTGAADPPTPPHVPEGAGTRRVPWSGLTESDVRSAGSGMTVPFRDAVLTDGGMERAVRSLHERGILLVTGTPTDDDGGGVAALAAAVSGGSDKSSSRSSLVGRYRREERMDAAGNGDSDGEIRPPATVLPHGTDGPLRTLYGGVWSTSSAGMADGTSTADSAYGAGALPLHTDMTYLRDPPGLQIFTMVTPASRGGESVFGDGLAAAERLRRSDPASFDVLCRTVRRYRCVDDEAGWHLEGKGPIISAVDRGERWRGPGGRWGPVTAVRHNDLDRIPDLPPPGERCGRGRGVLRCAAARPPAMGRDSWK